MLSQRNNVSIVVEINFTTLNISGEQGGERSDFGKLGFVKTANNEKGVFIC